MNRSSLAVAKQFAERLHAGAQQWPDASVFALVDWGTMGRGPAPWASAWSAINLFEGTPDAAHASMAPLLLPVPSTAEVPRILQRLADLETQESCVHWLWTHEAARTLSHRLQSLFIGELADGGRALVRYYDRAIWFFLCDMLDTEQQSRFFGPLLAWSTLEGETWRTHLGQDQRPPDTPSKPLIWTPRQVQRINLAALPLQLFEDLKDDHPDKLTRNTRRAVESLFAAAVQRADALGVKTYRDFMLYALLALTIRHDFDAHREVQQQLQRFKQGHCTLSEAIDAVPTAAWVEMGAKTRAELF